MVTRIILLLLVCTVKLSITSMMMAFIMPTSPSSIVGRVHNVDGVTTLRITNNAANVNHLHNHDEDNCNNFNIETTEKQLNNVITTPSHRRRSFLLTTAPASLVTSSLALFAATSSSSALTPSPAYADEGVPTSADSSRGGSSSSSMYSPKFVQSYDDFVTTSDGWSYKDVKIGGATTKANNGDASGGTLKDGDRVVFDWSGYTIGYFGRPFEAKGGPQGGAFDKDIDYFRTVLGSQTIISGFRIGQCITYNDSGGCTSSNNTIHYLTQVRMHCMTKLDQSQQHLVVCVH